MFDNRDKGPIDICRGCEAGHMDGVGCIKDITQGCWLRGRGKPSKFERFVVKPLAFLNSIEGVTHLVIASIGLWGCIAVKVYDIRLLSPVVENYIFGFFSIMTGIVMSRMIKKANGKNT